MENREGPGVVMDHQKNVEFADLGRIIGGSAPSLA